MIYFNVNIRNPFWVDRFKPIKVWFGKTPFKHKCWEIEIYKNCELFRIEFEYTVMQDHAGVNFEFALLGYQIRFSVNDSRHYDRENMCWYSTQPSIDV